MINVCRTTPTLKGAITLCSDMKYIGYSEHLTQKSGDWTSYKCQSTSAKRSKQDMLDNQVTEAMDGYPITIGNFYFVKRH